MFKIFSFYTKDYLQQLLLKIERRMFSSVENILLFHPNLSLSLTEVVGSMKMRFSINSFLKKHRVIIIYNYFTGKLFLISEKVVVHNFIVFRDENARTSPLKASQSWWLFYITVSRMSSNLTSLCWGNHRSVMLVK